MFYYNNQVLSSLKLIHICHCEFPELNLKNIAGKNFVWQTCLRTIIFSHEDIAVTKYSNKYTGEDAYKFLLEVICGLHSKMIGETEIISQFKQFIKDNPYALTQKISNKLIQNSKTIRNKYLSGYGGQSYGSYVYSASKEHNEIILLGAGALTQDILPIIKSSSSEITIKTKCTKKYIFLKDKYPQIKLETFSNGIQEKNLKSSVPLIVIAAPIKSEILEKYISSSFKAAKVLDMRAVIHGPKLKLESVYKYECLNDIFKNLSNTHQKMKLKLPSIKQDITKITEMWNTYALQRPYGWEDLC